MKINVVGIELKPLYQIDVDSCNEYVYGIESAKEIFMNSIGKRNVEAVGLLCLDSSNRIINFAVTSLGSISNVRVQLAEIFKVALLSNAVKIMVAHNHPSGIVKTTSNDIGMTKNIGTLAKLFDMELIDSVIVSYDGKVISIREEILKLEEHLHDK